MKTSDFLYDLPQGAIAQTPVEPRDHSRLLVWRANGPVEHRHFFDLPEYLRPGDALVINDTRVIPARLLGTKRETGAKVEFLLLRARARGVWEALVKPGRRALPGTVFDLPGGAAASVLESLPETGGRLVRIECEGAFEAWLDRAGAMPLPPYIHERLQDADRYQTVYARESGSAAAPTAGLHFTPELLSRIEAMGVHVVRVLLHVGLGTFRPVTDEDVDAHVMHSERYEVSEPAAARLNAARAAGGRVVCVGTTTVRTLESCAGDDGILHPGSGETSIFIKPGYRFRAVDALVTNFHLPGSTLLMLVSALMSREAALSAYELALREGYRFFSFGDAMLILPEGNHV